MYNSNLVETLDRVKYTSDEVLDVILAFEILSRVFLISLHVEDMVHWVSQTVFHDQVDELTIFINIIETNTALKVRVVSLGLMNPGQAQYLIL